MKNLLINSKEFAVNIRKEIRKMLISNQINLNFNSSKEPMDDESIINTANKYDIEAILV